jgi:hypothetical protein
LTLLLVLIVWSGHSCPLPLTLFLTLIVWSGHSCPPPLTLFLTLIVWSGHSCPLPLTLFVTLFLILFRDEEGTPQNRDHQEARTTVEERRLSAA